MDKAETVAQVVQQAIEAEEIKTGDAIEAAEERIEQAEENAANIAEAAMMTEIGVRVSRLEGDAQSWLGLKESLENRITSVETRVADLTLLVATLAQVEPVKNEPTNTEPSSLSLPMSAPTVTPEEVEPKTEEAHEKSVAPTRRRTRIL